MLGLDFCLAKAEECRDAAIEAPTERQQDELLDDCEDWLLAAEQAEISALPWGRGAKTGCSQRPRSAPIQGRP